MAQTALFLLILFPFAGAAFAAMMKSWPIARLWALLVSFLVFVFAADVDHHKQREDED